MWHGLSALGGNAVSNRFNNEQLSIFKASRTHGNIRSLDATFDDFPGLPYMATSWLSRFELFGSVDSMAVGMGKEMHAVLDKSSFKARAQPQHLELWQHTFTPCFTP